MADGQSGSGNKQPGTPAAEVVMGLIANEKGDIRDTFTFEEASLTAPWRSRCVVQCLQIILQSSTSFTGGGGGCCGLLDKTHSLLDCEMARDWNLEAGVNKSLSSTRRTVGETE